VTASLVVEPAAGRIRCTLRVPGDKSISHRALLLAALAEGTSTLRGLSTGDDVVRTARAITAIGAVIDGERVAGGRSRLHAPARAIDVGNSGTAIRLLAGVCAGLPWATVLDGDASIRRRPMDRVAMPLREMGADIEGDHAPLKLRGRRLHGVTYSMPVASAQVKSAVLLAGLGADGDTVVHEPVETRRHTEELLVLAGAAVVVDGLSVRVTPGPLAPITLDVPGDPSQAAFWLVAAAIVPGSEVVVENVYVGPARAAFLDVLRRMGAAVEVRERGVGAADVCVRHAPLHGTEVGGAEVPGLIDEIPVLAVAAAYADSPTAFRDAAELRVKESDRVASICAMLTAMGAHAEPREDGLVIAGGGELRGGAVDSQGDHRIAMAAAVAALAATSAVTIEGWDAVRTSYPSFEEDLLRCAS
jgi:3-phosphoshikimate 1-carboxyvinyltransferase